MILFILSFLFTEQISLNESDLLNGVIRYLQRTTQKRFLNDMTSLTGRMVDFVPISQSLQKMLF